MFLMPASLSRPVGPGCTATSLMTRPTSAGGISRLPLRLLAAGSTCGRHARELACEPGSHGLQPCQLLLRQGGLLPSAATACDVHLEGVQTGKVILEQGKQYGSDGRRRCSEKSAGTP